MDPRIEIVDTGKVTLAAESCPDCVASDDGGCSEYCRSLCYVCCAGWPLIVAGVCSRVLHGHNRTSASPQRN